MVGGVPTSSSLLTMVGAYPCLIPASSSSFVVVGGVPTSSLSFAMVGGCPCLVVVIVRHGWRCPCLLVVVFHRGWGVSTCRHRRVCVPVVVCHHRHACLPIIVIARVC